MEMLGDNIKNARNQIPRTQNNAPPIDCRSFPRQKISEKVKFLTRCSKTLLAWCFLLAFAGLQATAESVAVATKLEIRLQQPISSYATPKGTKISGVLIAPLTEGGDMLLPLGTTVEGSVTEVRKVGIGVVHETARIELQFNRVVLSDGESVPLQCRVTE